MFFEFANIFLKKYHILSFFDNFYPNMRIYKKQIQCYNIIRKKFQPEKGGYNVQNRVCGKRIANSAFY